MSTVSNPSPHTSPLARARAWLVRAQLDQVWNPAQAERGVVPGTDAIPGVSHPDFGKKFGGLAIEGQHFVTLLTEDRIRMFKELVPTGKFQTWIDVGAGLCEFPSELREELAYGLHKGWRKVRRELGLVGHVGDIGWDHPKYDPTWKENDRKLVDKWAVLLFFCQQGGTDGTNEDLKALIANIFAG